MPEDEEFEDDEEEDEESESIEDIIENTQTSNFQTFRTSHSSIDSSLEINDQEQAAPALETELQNTPTTTVRAENEPEYTSATYQATQNYDEGTYPEQVRTSAPTNPFLSNTFSGTPNFASTPTQGMKSTDDLASSEPAGMEIKKYESVSESSEKSNQDRRRR